jgi:hypothetical protein
MPNYDTRPLALMAPAPYSLRMHQESFGSVVAESPNVATGLKSATVPSSRSAADAQLRRELNSTGFTAARQTCGGEKHAPSVGFHLRRNLSDHGTTNCFSSH